MACVEGSEDVKPKFVSTDPANLPPAAPVRVRHRTLADRRTRPDRRAVPRLRGAVPPHRPASGRDTVRAAPHRLYTAPTSGRSASTTSDTRPQPCSSNRASTSSSSRNSSTMPTPASTPTYASDSDATPSTPSAPRSAAWRSPRRPTATAMNRQPARTSSANVDVSYYCHPTQTPRQAMPGGASNLLAQGRGDSILPESPTRTFISAVGAVHPSLCTMDLDSRKVSHPPAHSESGTRQSHHDPRKSP